MKKTNNGRDFENQVRKFMENDGYIFYERNCIKIGFLDKKNHKFDLICEKNNKKYLIECKSYYWRNGGDIPHGKIQGLNEAILYLIAAPENYEKVLIMKKTYSDKKLQTLARYYYNNYKHFINEKIKLKEFDIDNQNLCNISDCH